MPSTEAMSSQVSDAFPVVTPRPSWTCGVCHHAQPVGEAACRRCGGELPQIDRFELSADELVLGEQVQLSWATTGARSVSVDPLGESWDEPSGLAMDRPSATTTYVLTARNEVGLSRAQRTVELAAPKIVSFGAADTAIEIGKPVILHWEVENGAKVWLDRGIGEVSGRSFVEVYLTEPGPVALTVENASGKAAASCELTLGLPQIDLFFASTETIRPGEPVTLYWEAANAERLELLPEGREVTGETHCEVWPEKTTRYLLRAHNAAGIVGASLELTLPPPAVVSFGGETHISLEGEPIELSWEVVNAYEVTIEPELGPVPAKGTTRIQPKQAYTTFVLTATGHSGQVQQEFMVLRFPLPVEETLFFRPVNQLAMHSPEKDLQADITNLENLEKQLKQQAADQQRLARIQRAKEMELTQEMLSLKKASVREELQTLLKRFKAKWGKSTKPKRR